MLIGNHIQQSIVSELKCAGMFGIIADETMDISKQEQMSIRVCYVTDQMSVHECFLGFWSTAKTDDATLFNLCEVLQSLGLSLSQLRAQCYDGATNMRGRYSGLATLVQTVESELSMYIAMHIF